MEKFKLINIKTGDEMVVNELDLKNKKYVVQLQQSIDLLPISVIEHLKKGFQTFFGENNFIIIDKSMKILEVERGT